MASIHQQQIPFEVEILTPTQQLNEYIMTSLRTMEGLSLLHVEKRWGNAMAMAVTKEAQAYLQAGNMLFDNQYFRLTNTGRLLADGIASDLFQ